MLARLANRFNPHDPSIVRQLHRVLEVGTGSGYQTAILAKLAGEVYSIERVKPLLDDAWARLKGTAQDKAQKSYVDLVERLKKLG